MPDRLLLGLIGAAIGPSLSPALHEQAARRAGLDAHYHLIDLEAHGRRPADLPRLLDAAQAVGFAGLNITHPCKEAVLPLLDEVAPAARAIGAVNTVVFRDGRRIGHNTDCEGFRRAFETFKAPGRATGRVLLIGAGGAGRAVAQALLESGVGRLTLADESDAKATLLIGELAARFGAERVCRAAAVDAPALAAVDGIVNATPCGMAGHHPAAFDLTLLRPSLWVADVVYFPLDTPLLRAAAACGAATLDGGGMCVHQAAAAFQLFTGRDADRDAMEAQFRAMIAERLAGRA